MPRPTETPIGLLLARTAKAVDRAFDDVLAAAGSSRSACLILMALKSRPPATQVELAEAIGIRDATLSHHLNALETAGLVTRVRNPGNRRVHQVALTEAGEATCRRLAGVVRGHDRRLRAGLDDGQIAAARAFLERMRANVT